MALSKRTAERLREGIRRFPPIVRDAKSHDVAEADMMIIVTE